MPRDLTAGMISALEGDTLRPLFFVEIELATSPVTYVRVWTGYGEISWNSKTWSGVGELGGISPLGETTEIKAEGVKLTLSGIPANLITVAMEDAVPGLNASIWMGLMVQWGSPLTDTVLADPFLSFAGKTDSVRFTESGDTATIEIAVENKLISLHRAKTRRYTHEDQQQEFPGDMGFEFVERLQELNLTVGRYGAPPFVPDNYGYVPPEPEEEF